MLERAFEPALVFKGTTSREDWLNNFAQGADRHSDYYERAVELGDLIQRSGAKIHITGHSLGGGMASAASRASGMEATTFNAAGLHPNTVERYGGTLHIPEQENIAAYRVRGEVLTNLQEQNSGFAIPSLAGWGQQQLAKKLPSAAGTPYELPGRGISRIDRHSMTQVIDGLEAEKAFDQRHLAEATGTTASAQEESCVEHTHSHALIEHAYLAHHVGRPIHCGLPTIRRSIYVSLIYCQ